MSTFSKSPPRKQATVPGADAFISGADTATIATTAETHAAPSPAVPARRARTTPAVLSIVPADNEPEVTSQTVRLTARQKEALQRLAKHEDRSEQKIISRLLGPALLAAAAALDDN